MRQDIYSTYEKQSAFMYSGIPIKKKNLTSQEKGRQLNRKKKKERAIYMYASQIKKVKWF